MSSCLIRIFLITIFLTFSTKANVITPTPSTKPNSAQQAQIDRKYGMFCHFGINTYADKEWTDGTIPPAVYAPPADLAQKIDGWVKTAHDAGMRYFICITKHHDGFCMWNTKDTSYCIENPKVKNHIDVVKAVADACKKYNIKLALYYSLWDRHEPSYQNPVRYAQYMKRQLTELMTKYGPVCELWLDGSWERSAKDWHLDEIYDTVKRLQPDCQISANWTIGLPGNSDVINVTPARQKIGYPIRYFPSDFRLSDPNLPVTPDPKLFTHNGKTYYLPFEATVTVSARNNWFSHPTDTEAKSVDQLEDTFYTATAQDNCLVFNIPPDRNGNLVPAQVKAVMDLAQRLNLGPGKPFPKAPENLSIGAKANASAVWKDKNDPHNYSAAMAIDGDLNTRWASGPAGTRYASLEVDFNKPMTFNQSVISEYGDRIRSYQLEAWDGNAWKILKKGTTLSNLHTDEFPATTSSKLRLNITNALDAPSMNEFKILSVPSQKAGG